MARIQEFVNPEIVKNLGQELLNVVGTQVSKADTSLFERKTLNFRDIIDNNFPTMLVVDYNNIKLELKQYQDIDQALKTYIDENYKTTAKDYSVTKFSDKEIELILRAIKLGIQQVATIQVSYKQLEASLRQIYEQDIPASSAVQKTKQLFSKVYRLTDNFGNSDILIFPTFARISDLLRNPLKAGIDIAETEAQIAISNLDSIGSILAYGHTAVGYTDSQGLAVLNFNSPKLLAIMFEVIQQSQNSGAAQAAQEALSAATSFVNDTKQTEVFLSIDRNFSEDFVKMFVSIGGNIVRFENSLINSRRGTVLEKKERRGVNKAVLDRLATAFSQTQTTIGSRLARYIRNSKGSPNLLEYVSHVLTTTLKGEKPQKYSSKKSEGIVSTKSTVSKQIVRGIIAKKVKLPKLQKPKTIIPSNLSSAVSLVNLQRLLDTALVQQVKQNMGSGNRRDILNLRSGRFAESVKVERLSESRQGMITAFYSYMKNPYATFSQGGQQETPRSRDPKLLIAKSIRDVASQQVTNRLRAVSV